MQGVIGFAFSIPFWVVALVLCVTAALLYERGPQWDKPGQSTERGYHSRRAGLVLIVGFDVATIATLLIDRYGPNIGLHGFGANLAAMTAIGIVYMLIYQWARSRWPAGSD
ncbi:MAG: hypothetical protein ACMG6S_06280 [Byssovorax sp.]